MVYVPWADYGICSNAMLPKGCNKQWCNRYHPPKQDVRRIWDEELAKQAENEKLGIPRPQPPAKRPLDQGDTGPYGPDKAPPPPPQPPAKRLLDQGDAGPYGSDKAPPPPPLPPPPRSAPIWLAGGFVDTFIAGSDPINAPPAPVRETAYDAVPRDNISEKPFNGPQKADAISQPSTTRVIDVSMYDATTAVKMSDKGSVEDSEPAPKHWTAMARDELTKHIEHQTSLVRASQGAGHAFVAARLLNMGATKRLSNGETKHVGPHPSTIRVSAQYISQNAIEKKLQSSTAHAQFEAQERSIAEAREDNMRLQGCTWIDNVRRALSLPIRTYMMACVCYHKFRLAHSGTLAGMEYGNAWADACAASLLAACKTEDTLKKSRDILAAAYNLKAPQHDQLSPDDTMFEAPSRAVIGLERMVLEAGGFDFRSKMPQDLLVKIGKFMPAGTEEERKEVTKVAFSALTDLYRTYAPLKQTSSTMAVACLELGAQLVAASSSNNVSAVRDELQRFDYQKYSTSREMVMETLLDLLDLYTQHTSHTILGSKYSLETFLRIRLGFNKECSESNIPRYTTATPSDRPANGSTLRVSNGHPTPVSPPQPGAQTQGQQQVTSGPHPAPEGGGTLRFMLNPQLAADEKAEVKKYFVEEWEEYDEEVEVAKPPSKLRDREGERAPHDRPLSDRTSKERPLGDRISKDRPKDGGRSERSDRDTPKARDGREREDDRLRDRDREAERDRARAREKERERERDRERDRDRDRERDRRYDDRRYDDRERDRRFDDRRDRRYDDRRFSDDRRRRDDRR